MKNPRTIVLAFAFTAVVVCSMAAARQYLHRPAAQAVRTSSLSSRTDSAVLRAPAPVAPSLGSSELARARCEATVYARQASVTRRLPGARVSDASCEPDKRRATRLAWLMSPTLALPAVLGLALCALFSPSMRRK